MLGSNDLMNRRHVENLRRSLAMLRPGAPAFDRDEGHPAPGGDRLAPPCPGAERPLALSRTTGG